MTENGVTYSCAMFCFAASFILFYFGLSDVNFGVQMFCLYVIILPYVFSETFTSEEEILKSDNGENE